MQKLTQIGKAIGNKLLDLVRGFDVKNLNYEESKKPFSDKEARAILQRERTIQFFKNRAETRKITDGEQKQYVG